MSSNPLKDMARVTGGKPSRLGCMHLPLDDSRAIDCSPTLGKHRREQRRAASNAEKHKKGMNERKDNAMWQLKGRQVVTKNGQARTDK